MVGTQSAFFSQSASFSLCGESTRRTGHRYEEDALVQAAQHYLAVHRPWRSEKSKTLASSTRLCMTRALCAACDGPPQPAAASPTASLPVPAIELEAGEMAP